jgi:hypothetical protein
MRSEQDKVPYGRRSDTPSVTDDLASNSTDHRRVPTKRRVRDSARSSTITKRFRPSAINRRYGNQGDSLFVPPAPSQMLRKRRAPGSKYQVQSRLSITVMCSILGDRAAIELSRCLRSAEDQRVVQLRVEYTGMHDGAHA